ncbi:MAG: DUF72 domain-containing protein [Bacteroidota bacterium]|nr:DUF72 domain-containing protein [Bacteroidota bacterium]
MEPYRRSKGAMKDVDSGINIPIDRQYGKIRIGTAGCSIPSRYQEYFTVGEDHLSRYSAVLNAVEINSTFYRAPRPSTIQRWLDAVPASFRFSLKLSKSITHELRFVNAQHQIDEFVKIVECFSDRAGPILIQIPPSLEYCDAVVTGLEQLRDRFSGAVVFEPRNVSWLLPEAETFLRELKIGRVAADPARAPALAHPSGHGSTVYFRWHGSPVIYRSAYSMEAIQELSTSIQDAASTADQVWVIFDNTASGAATLDALTLLQELEPGINFDRTI